MRCRGLLLALALVAPIPLTVAAPASADPASLVQVDGDVTGEWSDHEVAVSADPTTVVPACQFSGFISPGESIEKSCLAVSPLTGQGTVHSSVVQDSIRVYDESGALVTGARADTFAGFFRYSLETQLILTAGDPADGEANDQDIAPAPGQLLARRPVCTDMKLTDVTWEEQDGSSPCRIGRTRAAGRPYFHREYLVRLTMLDSGNQTEFAGWGIGFDERQHFRSATRDCGAAWTCESIAPGLYTR